MGQVIDREYTAGRTHAASVDGRRDRRPVLGDADRVAPRPIGSRSARPRVERQRQHHPRPGVAERRRTTPSSDRRRPAGVRPHGAGRRRTVVGVVFAALVACGIVLAHDVLAGSSGLPASASSSRPAPTRAVVTALPGDTLWGLAEQYRGDVSIDRYVELLVRLNGGPSIAAGQSVLLP